MWPREAGRISMEYNGDCRKCGLPEDDHIIAQGSRKREDNRGYRYEESVGFKICPTALYTPKGIVYEEAQEN